MKKCPYCAEEIQDEAIVCRYCGRELTQNVKKAAVGVPTEKKNSKMPKWLLIAIVAVVGLCVLFGIISSFTKPSTDDSTASVETIVAQTMAAAQAAATDAPTATPAPTSTPVFWDPAKAYETGNPDLYSEILKNKSSMTEIQFGDYLGQQVGKRVHMKATVNEVHEDRVYLSAQEGGLFDSVYLSGLSKEFMIALNKGQLLEFDATITEFDQYLITVLNLTDPVVYAVK